jgi:hypothetical protein
MTDIRQMHLIKGVLMELLADADAVFGNKLMLEPKKLYKKRLLLDRYAHAVQKPDRLFICLHSLPPFLRTSYHTTACFVNHNVAN